jgi:hypothetical protein
MSSGFNTDVRVGEDTFHVQTEDRGPDHPVIDTSVYHHGRVVHRLASDYRQLSDSPAFASDTLPARVEEQHRKVIEDLRAGKLDIEIAAAREEAARAGGIQVQLLNPDSWLAGGDVSLDVEVSRRADLQPQTGAEVEATIEGALEGTRHCGTCDHRGRVRIQFPLPPLGKNDLALVIQARADGGNDEIRFSMRSRSKTPPVAPAPPASPTTS